MAELAVTDGMPPPADLPLGEFWCTSLADGTLRIDHADPRVLISGELLDIIDDPDDDRWFCSQLDAAGCTPGNGWVGAILYIHGVNRTVIYRITDMVPRINGYIGEWPA